MLRMLDLVMWSYYDTNTCHFNNNVTPNVLARTFSMMNLTAMMQLQQQAVKIRRLVVLRDWLLYSADARARVRQRDRHHTAHVRAPCHLPEQDERPQRLFPHAPHSSAAEAAHAGVLPDDLVTQQRHRHAGGDPLELHAHGVCDYKKLSYRRGTARCVVSVEILPIATQHCRNYLYDKSWTNRSYEVEGLQWADV